MIISALCPTYNRYTNNGKDLRFLLEEAVCSFLMQADPQSELLICNDTPGQLLECKHPQVKVFNLAYRLPDLSAKLQWLIDHSQGDLFVRWDDDDINLPWRFQFSRKALQETGRLEWRPENYWFDQKGVPMREVCHAGNTHLMALWHRNALVMCPAGRYPAGFAGGEDQAFNKALHLAGYPRLGERIRQEEMFYLYRWGTGSSHLSGLAGGPPSSPHQPHWDKLGTLPIEKGMFTIEPKWHSNHINRARAALGGS